MYHTFSKTIILMALVFITFPIFSQQAGFQCFTGEVMVASANEPDGPCETYYSVPCSEAIDYAPDSTTEIKYVRVVLHFFQNEDSNNVPFPPGNFTAAHLGTIRSWFDHPGLGLNYRLANVCDPLPKVPGAESPRIEDTRFRFIFNGIENEDVFFYKNAEWWSRGRSNDSLCPRGFWEFNDVINSNTTIQNDPDLYNALHVFFPSVGATFDENGDIDCIDHNEGGYTYDFGYPGSSNSDIAGITLFGTYYRYIYDSTEVDLVGYDDNGYSPNLNHIPYGANGILAEWLHIMSVDHFTAGGSHLENDFECFDGQYDRCDDTPLTGNQNIYMSSPPNHVPGSYCGLTECQLGRAHYFAERNRLSFFRFASNNFAYPTPWHDCQIFENDLEIDDSQPVNWNKERQLNSNLIVKSGSILNINCDVFMPDNGKIIVEPNAQLIINGRVTARCDYWAGIEVWGGPGSQYVVNGGRAQGYVRILSGGTIENAVTGVKLYGPTENESGGILIATGATFKDNAVSVEYAPFDNYWPFSNDPADPEPPRDYISSFTNCDFIIGNIPSLPVGFEAMVKMNGVNGVTFRGCNFNNTFFNLDYSDERILGYGILATDSGFKVTVSCDDPSCTSYNRSYFRRFGYAIHTSSAIDAHPFLIDRTDFERCYYGVFNSGISNATIVQNEFKLNQFFNQGLTAPFPPRVGVYLEGKPMGMTVQENQFVRGTGFGSTNPNTFIGIYSRELGEFNNEIRRNTFEDLTFGNIAQGFNAAPPGGIIDRGLTYLCNDNIDTETDFAVVNYPPPLDATTRIREGQGFQFFNDQNDQFDFRASGNKFSYVTTDFNNAGEPIDYYYLNIGVNETPQTFFGDLNPISTIFENACPVEYCAPPCMSGSELDDEKILYYDAREDRNSALARYVAAENANDSLTMASKALETTYYQRAMDKSSNKIVTHLFYDTLNFDQDTLNTWIDNLELGSAKISLALQQQSQGNYPEATATLGKLKGNVNTSATAQRKSEHLSILMDVLDNTSIHRLPLTSLSLLENMAEDVQSHTGNLARNILRSNGYYYAPIVDLPGARAVATESSSLVIENNEIESKFHLYPNPTNGSFTTYWNTDLVPSQVGQLLIRDATGRIVTQQTIRPFERRVHDLSNLKRGIYFYEVRSGEQKPIAGKILLN